MSHYKGMPLCDVETREERGLRGMRKWKGQGIYLSPAVNTASWQPCAQNVMGAHRIFFQGWAN